MEETEKKIIQGHEIYLLNEMSSGVCGAKANLQIRTHLRKTNKQTKLIPDNSQYKKAAVAVFWFRIPTAATQKNLGLTAVLNNVFFRSIYIVVLLQHSSSFHPSILTL